MRTPNGHIEKGRGSRRARSPFLRVRALVAMGVAALACVAALTAAPLSARAAKAEESGQESVERAAAGSNGDWGLNTEAVTVVSDAAARIEGVPFGLANFERVAKGTQRAAAGAPPGYRIPIQKDANLVMVRTPERALVLVDTGAPLLDEAGFTWGPSHDMALYSMLVALDERGSMGGATLAGEGPHPSIWRSGAFDDGTYRYRMDARDAEGNRYVTVTPSSIPERELTHESVAATGLDLGDAALWVDSARIVPADQIEAPVAPGPLDRLAAFLGSIDMSPLWVSLRTGLTALAFSLVLGLIAAWRVMGASSRVKGLLDSVFTIPMVLPPTVCGFLLLMLFGNSTAVGRWLVDHGIEVVFTWPAAVIAAAVVSFPLVYRTALGAFEALDAAMLDAARTLGWSEWRIFRFIMLPLAWPSIAAGAVLAFARAMGEFGCTLFFAGNYAGVTQTIPIAIYFEWMGGNTEAALFWVAVVIAFSFLVVWGINAYTARQQGFRSRGRAGAGAVRGIRGLGSRAMGGKRRPGAGTAGAEGLDAVAGEGPDNPAAPGPGRIDDIDACGGDAVRIDQRALRALLANGSVAGNDARNGGA